MYNEIFEMLTDFFERYKLEILWAGNLLFILRIIKRRFFQKSATIRHSYELDFTINSNGLEQKIIGGIIIVIFLILSIPFFSVLFKDGDTYDRLYWIGLLLTVLLPYFDMAPTIILQSKDDLLILGNRKIKRTKIERIEIWDDAINVFLHNRKVRKLELMYKQKHFEAMNEMIGALKGYCDKHLIPYTDEFEADPSKNGVLNPPNTENSAGYDLSKTDKGL